MSDRFGDERGAGSVLVLTVVAVLLLAFGAGLVVADLYGTGSRARTGADLAALAAAGRAAGGSGAACAQAAAVARANGTELVSCRVGGTQPFDVDVVVAAHPAGPLLSAARRWGYAPPEVRARALAGPARS